VFLVIWYFFFGSWFGQSGGRVSANGYQGLICGLVPISCKKKRCSHRKRCTRAKAKDRVRRWRHRALPVALVVRCRHRSSNKAPRLVADISEPVHWKWKKKNVGLSLVMLELKLSTLQGFCAVDHDFLHLPQLLKTFSNHDYHVRQIKLALDRVALLCGTYEMHQSALDRLDPNTLILIWDTGASAGLTPFWSDFIDYVKCEIDVRDITKVNKVVGIGTTLHKFMDDNGNHDYLPCVSYHLPTTDVRLFSPQIYHQLHGGHSVVNGNEMMMKFCKERASILIPINRNTTNLPVVHNSFVSKKVKREHASKFWSALHATGLYAALDYFANVSVDQNLSMLLRKQGPISSFPCVGGLKNENLSMPQKELLLWHWKLGIGMQRLQAMIQNRIFKDPPGRLQCHPPIIKTKFASTSSCAIPKCQSCELAWA
jgi:hypothetical protein